MSLSILLLLLFLPLVLSAQSQPNSCKGFFPTTITSSQNITKCMNLQTLGFKFGWNYLTTTTNLTVDIVFSATPPPGGWIAWGVNPRQRPQMVGTRAIIAFVKPDGVPAMDTYNITRGTKIGCEPKPVRLELDVGNRMVSYSEGVITVAATMRLPASAYDVSRLSMVWQMGRAVVDGDAPGIHDMHLENFESVARIDLGSGYSWGYQHRKLEVAHGVLSVIGWGLLLPMGAIIARYFKESPLALRRWFLVHVGLQILSYIIGTIAWGFGVSMGNESGNTKSFMAHRVIGILIFCLATLQMIALWLKPQKGDKCRKYWSIYHHFVGYALIGMSITNIFKGLALLRPPAKWKWTYIGLLMLMSSTALVLEITTWVKFYSKPRKEIKTTAIVGR